MLLSPKSLEKLRILINEETEYRSGPQLVSLFNQVGFNDIYGQGFPSRWIYTDQKLERINGTPNIIKCIRIVFNPANFIDRFDELNSCITELNKYIVFDKWKLIRKGIELGFEKLDRVEIEEPVSKVKVDTEDEFLSREFSNISVQKIGLEGVVSEILEERIKEIEKCYSSGAYLSVIIIAGSTLEGVLLGLANKHPKQFNTARSTPKDKLGKVRQFHEWSLSTFIEVAYELKLVEHDT